jgi:hypothetical protein
VAPLWSGLVALINQGLKRRVGFINPVLYQLHPASGAFKDITTGNNGDYEAGPGWDPCSGLGVANGQQLLNALQAQPSMTTAPLEDAPRVEADRPLSDNTHGEIAALLRDYFQTTRALVELLAPGTIRSTKQTMPVRAVSQSCTQKVLYCIGRQSGNNDLSSDPQIGNVGVQGFALAGCINQTFGLTPPDAFTTADFPQTITVSDCITKVCQTVGD